MPFTLSSGAKWRDRSFVSSVNTRGSALLSSCASTAWLPCSCSQASQHQDGIFAAPLRVMLARDKKIPSLQEIRLGAKGHHVVVLIA